MIFLTHNQNNEASFLIHLYTITFYTVTTKDNIISPFYIIEYLSWSLAFICFT